MTLKEMIEAVEKEIDVEREYALTSDVEDYGRLEALADLKHAIFNHRDLSYSQWMMLSQCIAKKSLTIFGG